MAPGWCTAEDRSWANKGHASEWVRAVIRICLQPVTESGMFGITHSLMGGEILKRVNGVPKSVDVLKISWPRTIVDFVG